jgi:2-amino-4-hydroxy-6-hydroxymethyldihydropteridine diphosphokinase
VGIGANLGDSKLTVAMAAAAVAGLGYGARVSSLYRTEPKGFTHQPAFCNAVVELWTSWPPEHLMALLMRIEHRFGRARRARWGPRTLDLDLLLYDGWIVDKPTMTLPHPRLLERRFVLVPLAELNPHLVLPNGIKMAEALAMTERQEVARW